MPAKTLKQLKEENLRLQQELLALKENKSFFTYTPYLSEGYIALQENKIPGLVEDTTKQISKPNNEPSITMIEGDNLGALVALNYVYAGKVDVLYIDPPYNTGKSTFSYNDKHGAKHSEISHAKWLSFLETRLKLAYPLMNSTGVVFVAVGVTEQAHLKLLMDSIFGEENFITTITVEGTLKNNSKLVSLNNEYWLMYAKDLKTIKDLNPVWRARKPSAKTILMKAQQFWQETLDASSAQKLLRSFYQTDEARTIFETEPGLKMYNRVDENGRVYRAGDLSSPSNKGGRYTVINPITGETVKVPVRGWVHSEETFKKMVRDNKIIWSGVNVPTYKRYLDENTEIVLSDIVKRDDRETPAKLLGKMLGHNKFTYPKNHSLIAEWIEYVLPDFRKKDVVNPPLILDFFAGSGSTGQAVAWLNEQDNGNRKCILVTKNENNIPEEITFPRLKAALTGEWATGKVKPLRGQLTWLKTVYLPEDETPKDEWRVTGHTPEYVEYVKRLKQSIR